MYKTDGGYFVDIATLYDMANGGALVLAFALFMWLVWHYISAIAPNLKAVSQSLGDLAATVVENQKVNEKLIENNASAFRELSMSNQNVATALGLLTRTMEQQDGALEKHDQSANYNLAVAHNELREVTRAIDGLRIDITRHVTTCDARCRQKDPHP